MHESRLRPRLAVSIRMKNRGIATDVVFSDFSSCQVRVIGRYAATSLLGTAARDFGASDFYRGFGFWAGSFL